MAWLWAVPAGVLVIGGVVVAIAARRLAEETTALARAGQDWRVLRPAVDEVVGSAGDLVRTAQSLRGRPERRGADEGHP